MPDPSVSETLVRVNYSETDQMGVAYHARYLVWLDIARTEHLRRLRRELPRAGGGWPPPGGERGCRSGTASRRSSTIWSASAAGCGTSRRGGSNSATPWSMREDGRLLATATVALLALDVSLALDPAAVRGAARAPRSSRSREARFHHGDTEVTSEME